MWLAGAEIKSVCIVIVGVFPCTQLADVACGVQVVFSQGSNFAASYRKQYIGQICMTNLRLIKLNTMVKEFTKSDNK